MKIANYYLALRKRIMMALRGKHFVIRRCGIRYLVDMQNHIDRHIEAYGRYEPAQLDYLLQDMTANGTEVFLDIGANLGCYTLAVARRFEAQSPDILAFEPDARNRAQLFANLFLNGMEDRVAVHACALSSNNETSAFTRHSDQNRGRSRIHAGGEHTVECRRLDDLYRFTGKVIAAKIDVEGHEMETLRGASSLLRDNRCLLQVEILDPADSSVSGYLSGMGYECIHRVGRDHFFSNKRLLS